jgi:hypothetical protein
MHGNFHGKSYCVARSEAVDVATVTKVAGTMEIDLDIDAEVPEDEVVDMFIRAIADSLGISKDDVVKLIIKVVEGSGLRRLQTAESKRYEVSYEVVTPKSVDPEVVVTKVNSITEPGSVEAQTFRQVLTETPGVGEVRQVVPKISAFTFEDQAETNDVSTTAQPFQAEVSTSWGIVVLIVFLVVLCLVVAAGSAIALKRRRSKPAAERSLEGSSLTSTDEVVVRIPSHTLLGSDNSEAPKKQISHHSQGSGIEAQASKSMSPSICSEGIWDAPEEVTPNLKRETSGFEV